MITKEHILLMMMKAPRRAGAALGGAGRGAGARPGRWQ